MKRLNPPVLKGVTVTWIGASLAQIISHWQALDFSTHAATISAIWRICRLVLGTAVGCFGLFAFIFGFAYLWNRYSDQLEARRVQSQPISPPQNLAG
jgi:hypothetical protein